MIEEGAGDLRVHLRSGVDEHGEGLDPGDAAHGHKQRGFVAADAVAVVEGDVDIVWFIAGRIVLERQTHIADFLRDELEERANPSPLIRTTLHKPIDRVRHRRRGPREVRLAQLPIPAGHRRPVLDRG